MKLIYFLNFRLFSYVENPNRIFKSYFIVSLICFFYETSGSDHGLAHDYELLLGPI